MVQLMLEGFGGDLRRQKKPAPPSPYGIECFHVNARISKNLEDIGGVRFAKLFLLLWHCLQAVWCRFRHGANILYYVPAPGKAAALYRDWLVMWLCRPFFDKVVFHWHATDMARWLETSTTLATRSVTFRLLGEADLSIVLSKHSRFNAEKLWPKTITVVPNGIPDPCPDFALSVLPQRQARLAARRELLAGCDPARLNLVAPGSQPEIVRVLFLAHCTRDKGLFDAVRAVLLANEQLRATRSPLSLRLVVAGGFPDVNERLEFEKLQAGPGGEAVQYVGFVQGAQKAQLMVEADVLCFPSHWETQPVSVIEALAYGMPLVISRLPSVQEMIPPGYKGVAELKEPVDIARALTAALSFGGFSELREHFISHFSLDQFFTKLSAALHSVSAASPKPRPRTLEFDNPELPKATA